jgi:hypothetical protein
MCNDDLYLHKMFVVFYTVNLYKCVEYVENNQQHALNSILFLFFFLQTLLHVLAKQCHPQGATMFLSEPLQCQYGRRQVIGCMTHLRVHGMYVCCTYEIYSEFSFS